MYQLIKVLLVAWLLMASPTDSQSDFDDQSSEHYCSKCFCKDEGALVDCSRRGLTDLIDGMGEEIIELNMSNNLIEVFPENLRNLVNLVSLDLSGNMLTSLPEDAFQNLTNLETINLSKNGFDSWRSLNPNSVLKPLTSLKTLNLSNNKFNTLANLDNVDLFISATLEILILENCNIDSISGRSPIAGLSAIKILKLSHNPIRRIQHLISTTLRSLDVSHAQLTYHNDLRYLPALLHLQMSHNSRLILSTATFRSDSLRYLDLSYCNLMQHGLAGLPNLKKVVLSHNLIRYLNSKEFINNTKLEYLDLANNNIASFTTDTFYDLKFLKFLDLSWNELGVIPEESLLRMPGLTHINLSRNYLSRVGHLKSMSVTVLDMSACEIVTLGKESLEGLKTLVDIDLSRNLISSLPNSLSSETLRHLNLNYNRISSVNNLTFYMLPNLRSLSVIGNRFTNIWSRLYFKYNPYLERLDLDDNTWRCDCTNEMYDFYDFITLEPSKQDLYTLRCHSPRNVADMTWLEACYFNWFPSEQVKNLDSLIWFILIMIIGLALCFVLVTAIRRSMKRRLREIQAEREQQVEEARDRLRQLRIRAEQEAQCNAPDPRDLISPPSYDEALTMPKLTMSTHSLNEAGSGKSRKRRGRRKTKSSGDLLEETEQNGDLRIGNDIEMVQSNSRNDRYRPNRYGSHEIAELDRSPSSRRRRMSTYDAVPDNDDEETVTINVEADVETPLRGRNRRPSYEDAMRESDF